MPFVSPPHREGARSGGGRPRPVIGGQHWCNPVQCVFCKQDNDRVVDSRAGGEGDMIRRRRECLACGRRFTTYERAEMASRVVIKKDGRREPFKREKLLAGMRIACLKRPIPTDKLEGIVDRVEQALFGESDREVESREVGERVIEELKGLDKVAYVRFASVYRQFTDVDEFFYALLPLLGVEALGRLKGNLNGDLGRRVLQRKDARGDVRNGSHTGGP